MKTLALPLVFLLSSLLVSSTFAFLPSLAPSLTSTTQRSCLPSLRMSAESDGTNVPLRKAGKGGMMAKTASTLAALSIGFAAPSPSKAEEAEGATASAPAQTAGPMDTFIKTFTQEQQMASAGAIAVVVGGGAFAMTRKKKIEDLTPLEDALKELVVAKKALRSIIEDSPTSAEASALMTEIWSKIDPKRASKTLSKGGDMATVSAEVSKKQVTVDTLVRALKTEEGKKKATGLKRKYEIIIANQIEAELAEMTAGDKAKETAKKANEEAAAKAEAAAAKEAKAKLEAERAAAEAKKKAEAEKAAKAKAEQAEREAKAKAEAEKAKADLAKAKAEADKKAAERAGATGQKAAQPSGPFAQLFGGSFSSSSSSSSSAAAASKAAAEAETKKKAEAAAAQRTPSTKLDELLKDRAKSPAKSAPAKPKPAVPPPPKDPMDFDKVKEILKSESPYSQNKNPWDV